MDDFLRVKRVDVINVNLQLGICPNALLLDALEAATQNEVPLGSWIVWKHSCELLEDIDQNVIRSILDQWLESFKFRALAQDESECFLGLLFEIITGFWVFVDSKEVSRYIFSGHGFGMRS